MRLPSPDISAALRPSPGVDAALHRLLVGLERPAQLNEWRRRDDRPALPKAA